MRQYIRYTLIFMNALLMIGGIGMLVCGIIFRNDVKGRSAFLVILCSGGDGLLSILLAAIICWAAIQEDTSKLSTYSKYLLLYVGVNLAFGISMFVLTSVFRKDLARQELVDTYQARKTNSTVRDHIDSLQKEYECCGIDGPNGPEVSIDEGLVIDSCCAKSPPCTVNRAYKVGCSEKTFESERVQGNLIGIILIVFGVLGLAAAAPTLYFKHLIEEE